MTLQNQKRRISNHILPTSATMIGVCMTVINIVKLVESQSGNSHADEFLAVDSVFFMISAVASYVSMRREETNRFGGYFERVADVAFILGLVVMTIVGVLITYEFI